jgi:hypothetical protein
MHGAIGWKSWWGARRLVNVMFSECEAGRCRPELVEGSHQEVNDVIQRRRILVHGSIQGVGFRLFIYHLATELNLTGFVRNSSGGVEIEIEGLSEDFQKCYSDHSQPEI